jgi:hypothetical protein
VERSVIASAVELIGRWDFPAAREVLDRALAGPPGAAAGLDGLTARRMLAEVLRELGETMPAYRVAVEVVRECQERHGAEHPATVRALGVLATVWHDRGELAEAERLYARIVAGRPDGPAGRWVLLARANLALLRRDQGENASAVRELTVAYTLHRRHFGANDLDTVRLAAELGRLHAEVGDLPAARRLLAVAHANARGALGDEHPLTGAVEAALAEVEPPMPSPPEPMAGDRSRPRPKPGRAGTSADGVTRPALRARIPGRRRSRRAAPARPLPPLTTPPVPASPPRPAGVRKPSRVRRHWRTVAAGLGAAVAFGAAGLALADLPRGQRSAVAAPAASAAPGPSDVTLRDEGSRITVTWTDPSAGRAGMLIAVARAGQPAGPLITLPAGTRQYAFTGLDDVADYCVMLAVAYPDDRIARAEQTCTHRRPLVSVANT